MIGTLNVNPELIERARRAASQAVRQKAALIAAGQGAGGAPPPDPAAMAPPPAMPPGAAPPTDPSLGGMPVAAPPTDPSLMGAPPQPGMAPPAAAAPAGGKGGKAQTDAKLDRLIADVYQLRHLLVSSMKADGKPLPDEAVLGPEPAAPPMDPNAMAPSPATAGAAAMTAGAPPGAPPGGMPGMPPGMPGMPPGGAPPMDPGAAKAAASRASLAELLAELDDNRPADAADDDGFGNDFWASLGVKSGRDESPRPMGTVAPQESLGALYNQPILLAMRARELAAGRPR